MKLSQLSSCGQGYKTWQQHNTDTPAAPSSSSRVNSVVVLPMLYNEHLCCVWGQRLSIVRVLSYVCIMYVWSVVMCDVCDVLLSCDVLCDSSVTPATQCLTQISAACGRREGAVLWCSEPGYEISRQFSQYSEEASFKHCLLVESTHQHFHTLSSVSIEYKYFMAFKHVVST